MENKKIYYEITNTDKQVTRTETDEKTVTLQLLECLYNKYVIKIQYIKQVQYSYNYTDRQKLVFIFNNGYRQTFYNVPTKLGALDIASMLK